MNRIWVAAFWGLLFAAPAHGQDGDLAERGRALAEANCGNCHAIGIDDESILAMAPPFRTFAEKWPLEQLEEALAEGIVTGHPAMPEFIFEPHDIDALIVYLGTLDQ